MISGFKQRGQAALRYAFICRENDLMTRACVMIEMTNRYMGAMRNLCLIMRETGINVVPVPVITRRVFPGTCGDPQRQELAQEMVDEIEQVSMARS